MTGGSGGPGDGGGEGSLKERPTVVTAALNDRKTTLLVAKLRKRVISQDTLATQDHKVVHKVMKCVCGGRRGAERLFGERRPKTSNRRGHIPSAVSHGYISATLDPKYHREALIIDKRLKKD